MLSKAALLAAFLGTTLVTASAQLAARDVTLPVRLTAHAVNLGFPGRTGALGTLDIVVNQWSSDAQRDRLLTILREKGEDKLLDALRDAPRVGYIRGAATVGWDLHYARHLPGKDGGDRIIIATDRPIGFREALRQPRSIDYPFTFIEIRIDPDGKGEGKMSFATKVTYEEESNQIVLENYASQPVLLQHVRLEGGTN